VILPDGKATSGADGGEGPARAAGPATPSPEGGRTGEAQGTIGTGGRRLWLYPKEVTGPHTRRRTAVAWILLFIYLGVPWLSWNGEPLLKLDVLGRKLVLASRYFWPQDLALFLPAALGAVVVVFLVTARWGRVWCGWACPQTVFLQFLFYPIERLVEGRATDRRARDAGPVTPDWLWRKGAKFLAFGLLSALIANTALAYFWGMDNLLYAIGHPSSQNAAGLAFVAAFSAVFFWVFAYFREQACVLICPYARFQSVLVDAGTSLVAYDQSRGEPRGRGKRGARAGLGDCVDCSQCVLVCPTGIDIRNGSQLECLGCMRCIDACDRTMEARGFPKGLVRYASLSELERKPAPRIVKARLAAYGALAALLFGLSAAMLAARGSLAVDVLRRGSTPYIVSGEGAVINTYNLHLRNRRARRISLSVTIEVPGQDPAGVPVTDWEGREFAISGGQLLTLPLEVRASRGQFRSGRLEARLVLQGGGLRETVPLVLAGPWGKGE
jgi:cytochrome c oxidase accessory protein FixG